MTVQVVGARRGEQLRVAGLLTALSAGTSAVCPGARVTVEIVDPDDRGVSEAEPVDEEAALKLRRDAIADCAARPRRYAS